jgi:hypothetical protein
MIFRLIIHDKEKFVFDDYVIEYQSKHGDLKVIRSGLLLMLVITLLSFQRKRETCILFEQNIQDVK